ncbi:MAG: LLM class F420-dependent oxidoreductase [Hyphomicrobiaceae bacterium]|nr:LLM class F420-dependent oxidoreductase [Hyphomicrobiaceae bacterium]
MRFGFYLPTRGPLANRHDLSSMLAAAERLGFASVMVADHIILPTKIESSYPYTVKGNFVGESECFEQLSLMAFVAGRTEKLRIVSSVMIVPHRNPVFNAKALATIDVLSGGRVTVGIGVGWLEEEFRALAAADFKDRGAVTDEYIEIFKKLWSGRPVSHSGRFYYFDEVVCHPMPMQRAGPPIWIGGHSNPALRRVARYGDGWHPVGATAASPLPPEEMREKLATIARIMQAEGRDFSRLEVSYKAPIYDGGMPAKGETRRLFTGNADAILEDIATFQGLGVHELVFDFRAPSLNECLDRMNQFSDEIIRRA